jgi:Domain of unknown function (DUF4878)
MTGIVAAALAGCDGGDSDPEDTVQTFVDALAQGDGQEACAQLTEGAQQLTIPGNEGFDPDAPCEDKVMRFFGASRGRLADATVEVTEESDSVATAEVTTYGEDPVASLELVKEGDEWRIDGSYVNLTRAYRFQF